MSMFMSQDSRAGSVASLADAVKHREHTRICPLQVAVVVEAETSVLLLAAASRVFVRTPGTDVLADLMVETAKQMQVGQGKLKV